MKIFNLNNNIDFHDIMHVRVVVVLITANVTCKTSQEVDLFVDISLTTSVKVEHLKNYDNHIMTSNYMAS